MAAIGSSASPDGTRQHTQRESKVRGPNTRQTVEEFIKEKINNHKVVIFSKTYCAYTKLSKNIFHHLDYIYHAVELDKRNDCFAVLRALAKMTGNDHTPFVFIKGKYKGGGTNLRPLHDVRMLQSLLDISLPPIYPVNNAKRNVSDWSTKDFPYEELMKHMPTGLRSGYPFDELL